MTQTEKASHELIAATAQIVSAYVQKNEVADLHKLIAEVYATLSRLSGQAGGKKPSEPAVPVAKSIMPDYLVCLEDGKKLKMLKRHLKTAYGMTPEEYRERWDLPADYPMVAPKYAEKRSHLAKKSGLGKERK